ncbi:MAG: SAM-dependent methyltransferase [Planctomycetota bacterium]|jgi:SAM-dependent methyltransferase
MALEDLHIDIPDISPPDEIRSLIDESNRRIDAYVQSQRDNLMLGFVPSDFDEVYRALRAVAKIKVGCFVEWGSGFGVTTLLAAGMGFDASGIEIIPELVDGARELAREFRLDAEFVTGSFVPMDAQDIIDLTEGPDWLKHGGHDGHDLLGIDTRDIDVVFAYPWPGEADVIEALFERLCPRGAILFTWNGPDGIKVVRRR